jgi:hypothetical protein
MKLDGMGGHSRIKVILKQQMLKSSPPWSPTNPIELFQYHSQKLHLVNGGSIVIFFDTCVIIFGLAWNTALIRLSP